MTDQNNDAPQINIIPADMHGDILVQLIKGQERSATALDLQNKRLFGGEGMPGLLPAILQQHRDLDVKLDNNKNELLQKIETVKTDLSVTMTVQKKETDASIKAVDDKYNKLNVKVNWFAGGLSALGSAATLAMGYIGLRARTGH